MKSILIVILFIINIFFTCSLWAEADLPELHQAVLSKNPVENIRRAFQNPNINPNAVDKNGNSALAYAVIRLGGNPEVLVQVIRELYKNSELDPNIRNNEGIAALHIGVTLGEHSQEVIRALYESPKLDPNVQNNGGITALHVAATLGEHSQEVIRVLYEHLDINPNIPSNAGATPLLMALSFLERVPGEVIRTVGTLFEHFDTDPSIPDPNGNVAINYVKKLLSDDSQLKVALEEILQREIKQRATFCYANITAIN